MNDLSTIAAAVTTALQGAALGQTFTVQRCFVPPDYNTAATNALKILVIGFEEDVDLFGPEATRTSCEHDHGVKVAIIKRISAKDPTAPEALPELDGISDFRQAVIRFLKQPENRVMGDANLKALKNSPAAYDPATLNEKKAFVSVIALTYRMHV